MSVRSFHSILTDCLEAMRTGSTVEQCLERFPKHAKRLRPMLSLAEKVSRTPMAAVPAGAQERTWRTVSDRVSELRDGKRGFVMPRVGLGFGAWVRPVAFTASFVLVFTAFGGGVAYASQDALPDSPLYPVKLAGEDVRLWFVTDDKREAEILLDQSEQRMEEILAMVGDGKQVPDNALSAMQERNERASDILLAHPEETTLRARVLTQAQEQEDTLITLWTAVPEDARPEYATAMAHLHNVRLDGGSGNSFVSVRPEELTGGILNISGQALEIGDGVWSVGGVEVRIDERTIGRNDLQAGTSASFVVARATNGRLHVLSLASFQNGPSSTGAYVSGAVDEVRSDGISVAGQFIPYDSKTLETFPVTVGSHVEISLQNTSNGVVANSVGPAGGPTRSEVQTFTFEGTIEGNVGNGITNWTIGGVSFRIPATTSFDFRGGNAASGARVQVDAINRGDQPEAIRITVLASLDTADTASIIGTFDSYDTDEGVWIISGLPIVPPETGEDPPEGAIVSIEAHRLGSDLVVSDYTVTESPDGPALIRLQGTVSQIEGTRWTLEFGEVKVDSTSDVTGRPDVGVRVILWCARDTDGSLAALHARVLDDMPVLTPTPVPIDQSVGQ